MTKTEKNKEGVVCIHDTLTIEYGPNTHIKCGNCGQIWPHLGYGVYSTLKVEISERDENGKPSKVKLSRHGRVIE